MHMNYWETTKCICLVLQQEKDKIEICLGENLDLKGVFEDTINFLEI